jgi:hypothetical protein
MAAISLANSTRARFQPATALLGSVSNSNKSESLSAICYNRAMSEPVKKLRECFSQMFIGHLLDNNALADVERFLNEPVDLSIAVSRCTCGWFDYSHPEICPNCSRDLVIRNQPGTEIIHPFVTPN